MSKQRTDALDKVLEEAKQRIDEVTKNLSSTQRKKLFVFYNEQYPSDGISTREQSFKSESSGDDVGDLESIDKILHTIENGKYQNIVDGSVPISKHLNSVGSEGDSIISSAIENECYDLLDYLSNLNVKNEDKKKVSQPVYDTVQSVISYTEVSMEQITDVLGNIFSDDVGIFGVE